MREKACKYVIENIISGNPRGVLFIDGGSTGYLFFDALRKRNLRDIVILTNNPLILGSFGEDERFFYQNSVFAIGGKLDPLRISLYSVARHGDFDMLKGEDIQIDIIVASEKALDDEAAETLREISHIVGESSVKLLALW
jgi:DeoR/GlpR family transcriptional regulator of sugar metabolism